MVLLQEKKTKEERPGINHNIWNANEGVRPKPCQYTRGQYP
jgi:hypothetical protein